MDSTVSIVYRDFVDFRPVRRPLLISDDCLGSWWSNGVLLIATCKHIAIELAGVRTTVQQVWPFQEVEQTVAGGATARQPLG